MFESCDTVVLLDLVQAAAQGDRAAGGDAEGEVSRSLGSRGLGRDGFSLSLDDVAVKGVLGVGGGVGSVAERFVVGLVLGEQPPGGAFRH